MRVTLVNTLTKRPAINDKTLDYRHCPGFTLTELLVVMAIIAVLIAIAVPTYNSIRESSQKAQCAANLRQIGAGIQLVVQDGPPNLGPGYYPFLDGEDESGRHTTWYLIVAQKLGLTEPSSGGWSCQLKPTATIFCCPANKTPKAKQLGPDNAAYNNLSYGYHDTVLGSTVKPGMRDDNVANLAKSGKPSKLIMVADSDGDGNFDYQISNWGGKSTWVGDRHKGGANTLFADGHVEWIKNSRFAWGWIPECQRDGIIVNE